MLRMFHAALDKEEGYLTVLRGRLDPQHLESIRVDTYQREIPPLASLRDLIRAFETGSCVPDIDLGMRGHHCKEENSFFELTDDIYVVDGLQRLTAAKYVLKTTGILPRLGAAVTFGSDFTWERQRFYTLNASRTPVSPNILIRNSQHDFPAVNMLYQLTEDEGFALHDRVRWGQSRGRRKLLTALTYFKVIGYLHAHLGHIRFGTASEMVAATQILTERIGEEVLRDNVITFFETVDRCWGIRKIELKEGAVPMRYTFLTALASVLSNHTDFWRGDRLFIESSLVQKIRSFPTGDRYVADLSCSAGKAVDILYDLMVRHINKGKRNRRLTSRTDTPSHLSLSLDRFELADEDAA